MKGINAAIGGVLAAIIGQVQANSDIVSLFTNGGAYIQEASATLVLPKLPSSVSGDVAIWSAIMMENQASFLQGVTSNSPSGSYCGDGGKNWCNFAYTLVGSTPTVGKPVTASAGSTVRTHYKLNSSTQLWDQNVYVDGKLVSSVSTSKGQRGEIFYISIECASGNCAATPAHSWKDVSIVLNKADQSFGHSGGWEHGATGGAMSSPDGGKTWKFATLSIPAQKAQ
ncbi:uncharacterized protein CTRU02_215350 [Colletotrichum truncatum]|uniref:Uncharacterized protein n=1 Tax=Colletotrichum truncatum TaxID=5467 RepID=A0ACC3YCZ7_COLTU|nr:uncharacterized protein CTRU02_13305 [Colletotrichum truncatum]KAF6783542.1 hypothetical protein CTRU02_13305 [Colletotrichum truncatum]